MAFPPLLIFEIVSYDTIMVKAVSVTPVGGDGGAGAIKICCLLGVIDVQ